MCIINRIFVIYCFSKNKFKWSGKQNVTITWTMKCCNLSMYHFLNDEIENSFWFCFLSKSIFFISIFTPYSISKICQLHTRTHRLTNFIYLFFATKNSCCTRQNIRIYQSKFKIWIAINTLTYVPSMESRIRKINLFFFLLSSNRLSCYFLRFRTHSNSSTLNWRLNEFKTLNRKDQQHYNTHTHHMEPLFNESVYLTILCVCICAHNKIQLKLSNVV